jgi:hypothetical protein
MMSSLDPSNTQMLLTGCVVDAVIVTVVPSGTEAAGDTETWIAMDGRDVVARAPSMGKSAQTIARKHSGPFIDCTSIATLGNHKGWMSINQSL